MVMVNGGGRNGGGGGDRRCYSVADSGCGGSGEGCCSGWGGEGGRQWLTMATGGR